MSELAAEIGCLSLTIEIGGIPVRLNTTDAGFLALLEERYAGFVSTTERVAVEFDVELTHSKVADPAAEVRVSQEGRSWFLTRGDFRAEWEPAAGRGWIRQPASPYSIDSVLRIVHTLVLAKEGGFLVHSASVIRNGKAFLFAGISGAGKTTISRLAPADVTLLTDEISYIRRHAQGYTAFGTPFAGELAKVGENVSAPIRALYLLVQGPENRVEAISPGEAARGLLANILFFAEDDALVRSIFTAAFEFVSQVPVSRLTFVPDSRVWELIG